MRVFNRRCVATPKRDRKRQPARAAVDFPLRSDQWPLFQASLHPLLKRRGLIADRSCTLAEKRSAQLDKRRSDHLAKVSDDVPAAVRSARASFQPLSQRRV